MIVIVKKSAIKDFKKIEEPYKTQIKDKIVTLQEFPDMLNIKKLVNFKPVYRLRVGNYRILFDVKEDTIEVARIIHRQSSYKK